jgi:serine/threonine-protein kinase
MSDLWARATVLFEQAVLLPEPEREAFAARTAGGDDALAARVLAMLRADAQASPLLDATPDDLAATVTDRPLSTAWIGRQIGPYRILGILGQGGMGIVCLAEREDVGKQVALKLVAGGLVADDRVSRFLLERRVLARLEHPNIAKLLDAGVTDDGTPWFAMEFVAGLPVDRHCEQASLPLPARLALFEKICGAVGYAHRHLIVHRDVKPANILVGEDGEPRLLDFGIAKLLAPSEEGDHSAATVTAWRPFTPMYASPEQLRGEPITTVSDVYQLGAVLFTLLTGQPPRASTSGTRSAEDLAVVPRPSRAVVADPSRRGWQRALAGDLDVIVAKATDPDPARRYQSVEQLADDISRCRRGLPIEARPATLGYRLGKLVTRHKVAAGATLSGLVALLGFTAMMVVQSRRIQAERIRSDQVSALLSDLFAAADPTVAKGETLTVASVLDRGLAKIRSDVNVDPVVKARLLAVIARATRNLGRVDHAVEIQTEVVTLLRGRLAATDARWLEALGWQTVWLAESGAGERAYLPGAEAVRSARTLPVERRSELARALREDGYARQVAGDQAGALARYQEAVELIRSLDSSAQEGLDGTLINLGYIAQSRGDQSAAARHFREAVERRRARLGPDDLATARATLNLASALEGSDLDEAERLIRQAGAVIGRIFTTPHADRLSSLTALARVLASRGKLLEAEQTQVKAVAMAGSLYGDSSTSVALAVANLAGYVRRQGTARLAEAARLHREAAHRYERLGPGAALSGAVVLTNLGHTEFLRGRLPEAEAHYRRGLAVLDTAWAGTTPLANTLVDFAMVLRGRRSCSEAEPLLRRAVEIFGAQPRGDVSRLRSERILGLCLLDLGQLPAAESLLVQVHHVLRDQYGASNEYARGTAADLARLYRTWGRPLDADRFALRAQ